MLMDRHLGLEYFVHTFRDILKFIISVTKFINDKKLIIIHFCNGSLPHIHK